MLRLAFRLIAGMALLLAAYAAVNFNGGTMEITLADLRDKIEGGWAGQMIGVSYGAPTEVPLSESDRPPKRACRSGRRIACGTH